MSLEMQNKELQMFFQPQKTKEQNKKIVGREKMIFCFKFCL
jgi:hypothetical protein